MDFRTIQREGTSFVYVMPFSATEALVEYTLFSKSLLEDGDYDVALKDYVHNVLGLLDYEILEKEFGVIPMTNCAFKQA
jgi:lycopene beta-cyclase